MTSARIPAIEDQIAELQVTTDALNIQYKAEKEMQLKLNVYQNYLTDRELKNKELFIKEKKLSFYSKQEKGVQSKIAINPQDEQNRFFGRR